MWIFVIYLNFFAHNHGFSMWSWVNLVEKVENVDHLLLNIHVVVNKCGRFFLFVWFVGRLHLTTHDSNPLSFLISLNSYRGQNLVQGR